MDQKHRAQLLAAKFHAWTSIGWGLIVMFLMLGVMSGHAQVAAGGAVILAVMWTLLRIGREALDGIMILRALKQQEAEPEDTKDEEE